MKNALLALLLAVVVFAPVPSAERFNSLPDVNKHHALLRLEDVGPGGAFGTLDGLGQLRAVFQYLEAEQVPFQVATIPHWKSLRADGTWYEASIDDPHPTPYEQKFIQLMQDTQKQGGILGMHGYTHQYGNTKRADNNENTGIGLEFNIKGAPETSTDAYAKDKIEKSLNAFAKAGLTPAFWESPHYGDNRSQEEVFRSYMGLLFQPDMRSLRSLKDINLYDTENQTGSTTLGSAYIPAPLKYIQNQQSVTQVINRLPNYDGLAAMYFHPFLEFPYLERVTDAKGKPVLQDGIPLYRYKPGKPSYLHQLVNGFQKNGFHWVTIFDVVPFSPAQRVQLPAGTRATDFLLGDVNGDGQTDVVMQAGQNQVEVIPGDFHWPRNRAQAPARIFLQTPIGSNEQLLLADLNGDKRQDLIAWNKQTGVLRGFLSNGNRFVPVGTLATLPTHADAIQLIDFSGTGKTDLLLRQGNQLSVLLNTNGHLEKVQPLLTMPVGSTVLTGDFNGDKFDDLSIVAPDKKTIAIYRNNGGHGVTLVSQVNVPAPAQNMQILASDTNGDGQTDLICYDAPDGIWEVLQSNADFTFTPIDNLFGPWAAGNRVGVSTDFDGNGKGDIASYDPSAHVLDVALSFRK